MELKPRSDCADRRDDSAVSARVALASCRFRRNNARFAKNGQQTMSSSKAKRPGPRIVVRRSGIHGRGVYARRLIREDETVCEYKGDIISEAEVARRYPENMEGLNHTFIFGIAHDHNIDGGAQGNIARWINHSCA